MPKGLYYFHNYWFVVCYFYSDKISNNVEEKVASDRANSHGWRKCLPFLAVKYVFLCINLDNTKDCKDQQNLCSFRIV